MLPCWHAHACSARCIILLIITSVALLVQPQHVLCLVPCQVHDSRLTVPPTPTRLCWSVRPPARPPTCSLVVRLLCFLFFVFNSLFHPRYYGSLVLCFGYVVLLFFCPSCSAAFCCFSAVDLLFSLVLSCSFVLLCFCAASLILCFLFLFRA
eukprot:SAG11_NODE_1493_length_4805_cov_14.583510_1_plen_152_part_00